MPPAEGSSASAEDFAVVADEHRQVLAAPHGLSTPQREVLVLRSWGGLSEAAIDALPETIGIVLMTLCLETPTLRYWANDLAVSSWVCPCAFKRV